ASGAAGPLSSSRPRTSIPRAADSSPTAGVAVSDVQAGADGRVWHLVERDIAEDELEAEIDWARRFDHMQQHTGQHILSAAFEREREAATLSSTLGAEKSVIEVDLADADWRLVERIEELANRVVWDD